jgi:hypothetical protein
VSWTECAACGHPYRLHDPFVGCMVDDCGCVEYDDTPDEGGDRT